MNEHVNKLVSSLYKGMVKKLGLIITFVRNTKIILLDEPYDGLDAHSIKVLKEIIMLNSKGKIIIIASPTKDDDLATQTIYLN